MVFSYPQDGQQDVPVGARIILHFSEAIDAKALGPCTLGAGGLPVGAFCVVGPQGAVATAPQQVGAGTGLVLAPEGGLLPGAAYQVWARPELLPAGRNLQASQPLFRFSTRQYTPIAGQAPKVVAIDDATPAAFADGGTPVPFLDFSTLRLLFSEPLDETTVLAGVSFQLFRDDASQAPVAGALWVEGTHLTFDPDADLDSTASYRIKLTSAITDRGGEALQPFELVLHPRKSPSDGGQLFKQDLAVASAPESVLAGGPVNTAQVSAALIGDNTLTVLDGGLHSEMADPSAFGGPIPLVIRKGQRLDLTPLDIRFGGTLASGYSTGTTHFTFVSDATGFLFRNPYRALGQPPDDARAPVTVDLTFDAALSSEDSQGNTLSNQLLLGVRLIGIATTDVDQLVIENVGAAELSTLGIGRASVNMALRLRTGATVSSQSSGGPRLVTAFPPSGEANFPPDAKILLGFSTAIAGATVQLRQGATAVPFSSRVDGTTLVVVPARRLPAGKPFTVSFSGVTALTGEAFVGAASDPAQGTSSIAFSTSALLTAQPAPPRLTAVVPGAPCAVIGFGANVRCAGGAPTDTPYVPFVLAANREIQVQFSEPMDPATLALSPTCGVGALRVEVIRGTGMCEVVPGTLIVRDRSFRFIPNLPWETGASYRLTLVGGPDATCEAGELCSQEGKPLNTDPLAGTLTGGGPDVVLHFDGAAPTLETYQPLSSGPFTDLNGNGFVDPLEPLRDENRVAMEVVGVSGIVTAAALNGVDCVPARSGQQTCAYVQTDLPVSVGLPVSPCPLDANGKSPGAGSCLPVRVYANVITSTSISMSTTAVGFLPINDLPTGPMIMRVREKSGPSVGYILNEAGAAHPQFVIQQDLTIDAPDMVIAGGLVSHDLKSKPFTALLKGPVTFLPDGRMQVALQNLADIPLNVSISALLPGAINLRIPKGEMHITILGPPLK